MRLSDRFVALKWHELFLYITGVRVYESKQQRYSRKENKGFFWRRQRAGQKENVQWEEGGKLRKDCCQEKGSDGTEDTCRKEDVGGTDCV